MNGPERHPELADALHRLVEAVGPLPEEAERPAERPELSQVSPRAPMSSARLAALVTVAAAVIAGAVVALSVLPGSGSDAEPDRLQTVAVRTSPDDDLSQLRSSLADARHEQDRLAAELAEARQSMRPRRWFEDTQSLTYRSPWRP